MDQIECTAELHHLNDMLLIVFLFAFSIFQRVQHSFVKFSQIEYQVCMHVLQPLILYKRIFSNQQL